MNEIIKTLTDNGGKLWESGDKRRIYFDSDLALKAAGYRWTYYNSGNISSATENGEKISNSYAKEVIGTVRGVKIWYDLTDGNFYYREGYTRLGGYKCVVTDYTSSLKTLIGR